MVPLGAVAQVTEIDGPLVLTRYNMSPSASINGNAAPGVSSGRAIEVMEQIATDELPKSMSFEWTELAYLELEAGNTAMLVFAFSIMMVFLVLAAQFESWSMPLAVILSVPLCVSCLDRPQYGKIIGLPPVHPASATGPSDGDQHLHSDRAGRAGWPGQQERDPDRRIRQGDPPLGQADPGSDARIMPLAVAADHHDLDGVHPRRAAALERPRRGAEMRKSLGLAVFSRHGGRDASSAAGHAGLLLPDRQL